MKAILTIYRGTLFRSKLEARYAKALNSLKIKWAYEVEGYEFDGIWYLPDFYLSKINVFIEVKGPSIPGIEKPTNLRKILESGATPRQEQWNPEVLVVVGDVSGNLVIAGNDERILIATCGQRFMFAEQRSFTCRFCGKGDGDHYDVLPRIHDVMKPLNFVVD